MLIGRGGETIKSLEQKTSARIEVSREDEKEAARRVIISGRTDSVERALGAILEVINSAPNRGEPDNGGECRRVIQVAQAFVGMIIGKGGDKIKAMSRDSGARIEVSRDDGTDDSRDITIRGEESAVDRAAAAIEEVIQQASLTFGPQFAGASDSDDDDDLPTPPPGFEACGREGWLHHPKRDAYYEKRTGRLFWLEPSSNLFKDLHHGLALDTRFAGAAALGTGAASSSSTAPPPKHVVIPDLHRVGQAMNLRLDHLDRPAAMLGVFGSAEGIPVDTVARGLHEKLVRRLGASRSEWPDDLLFGALTGALFDVGGAHGSASAVAAVALAVGRRVLAVASPGTSACLMTGRDAMSVMPSESVVTAGATTCFEEVGGAPSDSVCIALVAGNTELDEGETAIAVAPHLFQGRPRAASAALLQAARRRGARGSLAAACARVSVPEAPPLASSAAAGSNGVATAASGPGGGANAASAGYVSVAAPADAVRRPPVSAASIGSKPDPAASGAVPKQVRIRQILVRHWRGGKEAKPMNPNTRKPVSRSLEEAEARLLGVLDALIAAAPGGADQGSLNLRFSAACKKCSECQSALKGGEFAGDLGWLDQVKDAALKKAKDQPGGPTSVVKPTVPASVVRAAFELEVGAPSDFIISDLGVHLLLRTA